jgi:SOS-response transcriptional repressor LexA
MTEFLVRLRGDHLRPAYQNGDLLTVRESATADEGALAIVLDDGEARVRHYKHTDGLTVIGVVTGMNRRLP